MPTQEDSMISLWTCHERPALSMTPSCGMTTSANSDNTENQEQIAPVRINLPYVKRTSEQLKRIFNDHNINCTFYATTMLHTLLSHAKDPVQRNNIIYKYDCKD